MSSKRGYSTPEEVRAAAARSLRITRGETRVAKARVAPSETVVSPEQVVEARRLLEELRAEMAAEEASEE